MNNDQRTASVLTHVSQNSIGVVNDLRNRALKAAMASAEILRILDQIRLVCEWGLCGFGGHQIDPSLSTTAPWTFFDTHYAYNAGMILVLESLCGSVLSNEAQNSLHGVNNLLNSFAMKGNESASSCFQILRMLGPASLDSVQSVVSDGVVNDVWDLFANVSSPSQPLNVAANFPTFVADAQVDEYLPPAFNDTLGEGIVDSAEWEDLWKSIGISWDQ